MGSAEGVALIAYPVHCYDSELGGNPHALVLQLDHGDWLKYQLQKQRERPPMFSVGTPVEVTDQESGERYELASAPCGLGCHCAAVAVRLSFDVETH
jgi:hypothetical protein